MVCVLWASEHSFEKYIHISRACNERFSRFGNVDTIQFLYFRVWNSWTIPFGWVYDLGKVNFKQLLFLRRGNQTHFSPNISNNKCVWFEWFLFYFVRILCFGNISRRCPTFWSLHIKSNGIEMGKKSENGKVFRLDVGLTSDIEVVFLS